jgi:hypothetical protein
MNFTSSRSPKTRKRWIVLPLAYFLGLFLVIYLLERRFDSISIHRMVKFSENPVHLREWFLWSGIAVAGSLFFSWLGLFDARRRASRILEILCGNVFGGHSEKRAGGKDIDRYASFEETLVRFHEWQSRENEKWSRSLEKLKEEIAGGLASLPKDELTKMLSRLESPSRED